MNLKKNQHQDKKLAVIQERKRLFAEKLLQWNQHQNTREMPWKGEKDPYKIWLSEIILQQTRVGQGLKYYQIFTSTFPDIHALANAPDEKIFKLWEGLGYYSRCANLIASARFISKKLSGKFPDTYSSLLELKGIGSYTAAAIASFAYNLPYAVLDGNVFRVLSRIFDIETPIDTVWGKKEFSELAQSVLPDGKAAEYNQAIMDFGAVVCKPLPICETCFFNDHCLAYLRGRQAILPVKEKKLKIKKRWLHYFVLIYKDEVAIRKRTKKDIWKELHEFFLIETDQAINSTLLFEKLATQTGFAQNNPGDAFSVEQKLTHQSVYFSLYKITLHKKINLPDMVWIKISDLGQFAFPKTLQQYIAHELG